MAKISSAVAVRQGQDRCFPSFRGMDWDFGDQDRPVEAIWADTLVSWPRDRSRPPILDLGILPRDQIDMNRKSICAMALLLVAGCSSTYESRPVTTSETHLAAGARIAIATPEDGSYGGDSYPGSGAATAASVRAAFARHTTDIVVSPTCRTIDCLRTSHADATYFVIPMILHWEDRATEWSMKKDKIEIRIAIFDAQSNEISGIVISGKSKLSTWGGDHPQDLLAEPIQTYVSSLY